MTKKLEAASVIEGTPDTYLKIRDKAMHNLGIGTTHDMNSVITGIVYTVFDLQGIYFKGKDQYVARQIPVRCQPIMGRNAGDEAEQ